MTIALLKGCSGVVANVRIGIEREHAAVAPGRFLQVQEEAAIGVLDSAGERGRRHFRGLLAPGAGEVLVQDGQRALVSARHVAGHRQPVTHRLDIDEAGDAVLVVERRRSDAPSWKAKPKSSKPGTLAMSVNGIQTPSRVTRLVKCCGKRS